MEPRNESGTRGATRPGAGLTISLVATALIAFAVAAPAAAGKARTIERSATNEVRKFESKQSFNSPAAYVAVKQDGERLEQIPVSPCKAHFANERIDVLVSTCGRKWRLRAHYVSLVGKRQRFRLSYEPVG